MFFADVTQYLSATAYLDPAFRSKVLHDVLVDRSRIVTPPPQVDLGRVVRHCVAAHRRHLAYQLLLVATPALVALAVSLVELLRGQAKPLVLLAALAYGGLWGASKLLRRPSMNDVRHRLAALAGWILAVLLAALVARTTSLAVSSPLLGGLAGEVLAVLFHRSHTEPDVIKRLVLRGLPWLSKTSPVVQPRLQEIEAQQAGNVRMHAEWHKHPFVDCGAPRSLRRGVFPIQLDQADPALPVKDFEVDELVDHVRVAAEQIELEGTAGSVRAEDRIYIGDETARGPRWRDLTTGLPTITVQGLHLVELIRHPQPFARHHLAIVVSERARRDQLVFTMTVRFHRDGSTLTFENNQFLYFPLQPKYRAVDHLPTSSGAALL
jgi:hypothetical protein